MSTYPNSTTTMKARLLLSLLVVFKYIRCCAAQLDFLSISISSSVYEDCQQCLIERAGAIHLGKVDEFHKSVTEMYWVVGPSHYLRANVISCFGPNYCGDQKIEESRSIVVTEGIGGTSSPVASVKKSIDTYISNKKQRWATSADLQERFSKLVFHLTSIKLIKFSWRRAKKNRSNCVYTDPTSTSLFYVKHL